MTEQTPPEDIISEELGKQLRPPTMLIRQKDRQKRRAALQVIMFGQTMRPADLLAFGTSDPTKPKGDEQ